MISAILGKKVGMTQIFERGDCIPVTVIEVGPCSVLQVKTQEKDGYTALQLGYDDRKEKRATKSEVGHAKKANATPKKFVKEISWNGEGEVEVGKEVTAADIAEFKIVDISGVSKGKGFQGTVKRYGFAGGPASHGQGDRLRARGSIGCSASPARVFKGVKMAGQMGNKNCTVRNLKVVEVDAEKGLIVVKGGVPGHNGSYLVVKKSLTDK
ncbi:50S ribosomal protein L3 [Candidatus Uabimicrobium amorphum]|uniref:Large ribosomal subunit protein uL3 n=1 Tax=Uabimicrobium amorphum TaxID=2596890 RepID=A0A5S9IRZ0_UABAM|nr:50S ribosomal protein L3 [Candidatus Uabimicrobium amorphum]BBM86814.1 50S ribosomal protein L3 [Candidatus Uabimicrobium amorphum]